MTSPSDSYGNHTQIVICYFTVSHGFIDIICESTMTMSGKPIATNVNFPKNLPFDIRVTLVLLMFTFTRIGAGDKVRNTATGKIVTIILWLDRTLV